MINNIYCIGRNYSEHAKELGNNVETEPLIFSKPNSSLITNGVITLPDFSNDVHYETELVIKIIKEGFKIKEKDAETYYNEVAVGLDLTARDLQTKLKDKKLPWFLSKGFKDSCYVSDFIKKERLEKNINFSMRLNGEVKQVGNTQDMIFSIPQMIEYISQFIVLKQNDLIYTGTPKGVGQLNHGDQLVLYIEDKKMADLEVL